jgi:periplasmic divalent cation tolerance protein
MSAKALVVLTTCGSDEDADRLARLVVERRLAACVNAMSGVTSTYRWRGEVRRDRETLLIVKTTTAQFGALESTLRAESKYELPEVIALPIDTGSAAYLDWLVESVGAQKD